MATHHDESENGVSLVLAMVLLIVGSLIAVALADLSTNNLLNTSNYRVLRVVNWAADGAMDGAIQQARYAGACQDFPKTGTLQLTSNEYAFVHCTTLSLPLIPVQATNGSTTLTSPTNAFTSYYALASQPVTGISASASVPPNTTIISVTSPSTATMSNPATVPSGVSGTVYVGLVGDRLETFQACVSASPITSCTGTPQITATVLFVDVNTDANPPGETGYKATVLSWKITDANA